VATPAGLERARRLVDAADQVFTWIPGLSDHLPGIAEIAPAVIDTTFYQYEERTFTNRLLGLLFVADAKPRKGLDVMTSHSPCLTSYRRNRCIYTSLARTSRRRRQPT
jgi:hypothetical protein